MTSQNGQQKIAIHILTSSRNKGNLAMKIVLTKTRNQPKPPETSRNDQKQLRNNPTFQNWGNLEFCASFRFSNFDSKCQNLSILDKKVVTV